MSRHYPFRVNVLVMRTGFGALALCSFLAPSIASADIFIEEPTPAELPEEDIEIELTINGREVHDGDVFQVEQGVPLAVSLVLPEQHDGYIDTDYELNDGSTESSFYFNGYYLDFYKGDVYTDAKLISGELMNHGGFLHASTSVTFSEPGTYSAVFYDSGIVRERDVVCAEEGLCGDDPWTLEAVRSSFEQGENESNHLIASGFSIVTFTVATTTSAQTSNVLFLPGIKGSRLYRAGDTCGLFDYFSCEQEEKLWEPGIGDGFLGFFTGAGEDDIHDLFLNTDGKSIRSDVYVKEGDVLDKVGDAKYYASFIDDMNDLKSEGSIADWRPVAYDWRLSLDDLLENGKDEDGRISYTSATSTPYIEQTLRELAHTSKSGKVTIIAHSNGGLVAKALMQKLGDQVAAELVDKIILIGVPQSGAPQSVGALLFGYREGIPDYAPLLVSNATSRMFAEFAPMAYHLLPSQTYFNDVDDAKHPVVSFSGSTGYSKEIEAYGSTIDDVSELGDFLTAREGGRTKPKINNLYEGNILSAGLLGYATQTHESIDSWSPPEGVLVYQIAGWGVDTVAGVEFYELPAIATGNPLHRRMYRPTFVEDGDGVVPVPSALMMPESDQVKRYWINFEEINRKSSLKYSHGNILETPQFEEFIEGILSNKELESEYFTKEQPPAINSEKKLVFFLHSPLTLGIQDENGKYTGAVRDGEVRNDLENVTYGEFGEVQYLVVPENKAYKLILKGKSTGAFSLDIQEITGNITTSSSSVVGISSTSNTNLTMDLSGGIEGFGPLLIDEDGNGTTDDSIRVEVGETNVVSRDVEEMQKTSSESVTRTNAVYIANIYPQPTNADLIPNTRSIQSAINYQQYFSESNAIAQTKLASTAIIKENLRQTQTASVIDSFDGKLFFGLLYKLYYAAVHTFESLVEFCLNIPLLIF